MNTTLIAIIDYALDKGFADDGLTPEEVAELTAILNEVRDASSNDATQLWTARWLKDLAEWED